MLYVITYNITTHKILLVAEMPTKKTAYWTFASYRSAVLEIFWSRSLKNSYIDLKFLLLIESFLVHYLCVRIVSVQLLNIFSVLIRFSDEKVKKQNFYTVKPQYQNFHDMVFFWGSQIFPSL